VRLGARDYYPMRCGWTAKENTLFRGGANLYLYAHGDPLNFIDANGRNPIAAAAVILLFGGAVANENDLVPVVNLYIVAGAAAAVLEVGTAGGAAALTGAEAKIARCGRPAKKNSTPIKAVDLLKELNRLDAAAGVSPNASGLLTNFFRANAAGGNVQLTAGINRDLLLVYRQIAVEGIETGISTGANAAFQQARIELIDRALLLVH